MTQDDLTQFERRAGGVFSSDGANMLPLCFGDSAAEEAAARNDCALFDLSDRGQIKITGTDRAKFLQGFCTNDVKRLKPGEGCEAFVCNVKGKVVGHIFVFAADDALWIDAAAGAPEKLLPHWERYIINEDVVIADRSAELGELFVTGPRAAERLLERGVNVDSLAIGGHRPLDLTQGKASVRRTDWLAAPGYCLEAKRGVLAPLWQRLVEGGLRPAGANVFHSLRIDAGFPLFGIDFTDDNLAQEVGRTERAISFTKGCYLGQEPIARIDAMGHVNRELRTLRMDGATVPTPGSPVFADSAGAQNVGAITSSAYSHTHHRAVAMALLRTAAAKRGSVIYVQAAGALLPAAVT